MIDSHGASRPTANDHPTGLPGCQTGFPYPTMHPLFTSMNTDAHISPLVSCEKAHGLPQAEAPRETAATPSAAPLEKRSADGVGGRYGIFPSAEAAIAEALHTSACEGRTVPANEVEDLWKVVRGEISRQDLIKKYVAEALAKEEALERL